MSQQGPFDDSGVPPGGFLPDSGMVTPGYADASSGYDPQYVPAQYGGYSHPYEPQMYARHRVPMIDPIESAKLTPQTLFLLVLSGFKRHWKWSLPTGLILGLLTACVLYLAFPILYEATGTIQIRSAKQTFIFETGPTSRYDEFVTTQIKIMRSPSVIDRALEDPVISKLPMILKQRDKRGWLQKNLNVKLDGKSEIVSISIKADSVEASERIVNSVMEAYFYYIREVAQKNESNLLKNLYQERRNQNQYAASLQENIRSQTKDAASQGAGAGTEGMLVGLVPGESLKRDLAIAEAQLVKMKAKRTFIIERINKPNMVPPGILVQIHPELRAINDERANLLRLKENYTAADPRLPGVEAKIKSLETKIDNMTSNSDSPEMLDLQKNLRLEAEMELFNTDYDIWEQEILAKELKDQYESQLGASSTRAEKVVDVSFFQAQLSRTNKILEHIDERILTVSSEQRAPGQIVPLSEAVGLLPSALKQIMTVGLGAVMVSFFPLLLSIAIERMKPRLYHVSQVRRAIPHVLIGEIMEPPVSWIHGAMFRKRLARYRESVHDWCTHLLLSNPFSSCQTLSIASVASDDGKTFLAVQIAVAMSRMKEGKVLLIDGDMRVGRLHLLFGNEETGIGLADVLSFRNKLGEAVVGDEKEPNLFLLSAGQLDVTPYELLGDGRFREMLDSLKQQNPYDSNGYSLIIVVLPPVAHAAESLIMASSTDSTLLCVRQGETVLAAMEDVYRKLVNTGASVDGIVVKDIPYYQMSGRDGGFADKLEQIRLSHLLQHSD